MPRSTESRRQGRISIPLILVAITLVIAGGTLTYAYRSVLFADEDTDRIDPSLAEARRGNLVVSVSQTGQLESKRKTIIKSQVRERLPLKWVIDEGTLVEPGDELAILDDTDLIEAEADREQALENARSDRVSARMNLTNTRSQSQSDIAQAELDYEFAQLELQKYLEGAYPQELKQAQADVEIARETYQRAKNDADWSQRLQEQGYITQSEADADAAAANKAKLDMEVAEGRLALLKEFTYIQEKRRLESDVEQAESELERVRNRAKADIQRAEAEVGAAEVRYRKAERDLEQTQEDLENARLTAPVAGRVVYAPQGNRWRQNEPLSVGDEVRYDQEIIHLPESGAMQVEIKIEESQRDKVEQGMAVLVTGANLPESGLRGKLINISEYLDPSGWWNNHVKQYSAVVDLPGDMSNLRTGMNVRTEIIVAAYKDVIILPVQCVTRVDDQHVVYLPPVGPDADPQPVPVTIGLDNGTHVHVIDGVEPGQRVLQSPPLEPAGGDDNDGEGEDDSGDGGTTDADDLDVETTPAPTREEEVPGQPATGSNDEQTDDEDSGPTADDDDNQPPDESEEVVRLLQRAKDRGFFDRIAMDDDLRAKADAALEAAENDESVELEPETIRDLKRAFLKVRQDRESGRDDAADGDPSSPDPAE